MTPFDERISHEHLEASAQRPRQAVGYLLATAFVLLCALGRWLLDPLLEGQGVYLAFMIPVALSAYLAGSGPCALSIVLSTIIASPLFRSASATDRAAVTHVALFVIEAIAVLELFRRLHGHESETQEALAAAETARQHAEAANAAKERFVAQVSHEWRSPLNALAGWAWQIERRSDDATFVRSAAARMRQTVDTQRRLVADLLDYSRGSLGKLALIPQRIAVIDLVRRSLDVVAPDCSRKQIRVEVQDQTGEVHVWADPARIDQVLVNLLQNAIKFTAPGGRISLALVTRSDGVEISVTDNGVGIDPQKLATIFDAFAQSEERRDMRQGGLGLGLSIVWQLVHLHGGRVWATSAGPGHGSSFFVRLPISAIH